MTTFTLAFLFLSCIHISHAIQVPSIVRSPYLNLWTPSDKLASAAGGFPEAIFVSKFHVNVLFLPKNAIFRDRHGLVLFRSITSRTSGGEMPGILLRIQVS